MSAYETGSQDVRNHIETYDAVLRLFLWTGAMIGFSVLYLSMVFAGGMSWFTSMLVVYGFSLLVGFGLKRGGAWYAVMTGLAAVTTIIGWAATLIASMI